MKMRVLFALSLLLLAPSCRGKQQPPTPPPPPVTEFIVEPKNIPVVFDFVGFAESTHPVEIRGRVEGYLDKIAYQEGSLVHEGDLLFQLDPKQYEALVEQAKGEVMRQEAILANAKLTVGRLTPLYEQKAASKKDLDNATAQLLAAEATLQSAQATLLNNQINLGYTTIISPITGMTDKSQFREGALITPGPNSLMTTVSVLDPIWVYFTVSDNDILRITAASAAQRVTLLKESAYEVEAILSDGSSFPYKGKVDFSSPVYDQSTGTLLARAIFKNPDTDETHPTHVQMRPGQFVRVKVTGAERPAALLVPRRSLMQKSGGMFVYLINADKTITAQDVDVGEWYGGDYQIITNGLKQGDHVLVDTTNRVRPGMKVNVTGEWKPPADTNGSNSKKQTSSQGA